MNRKEHSFYSFRKEANLMEWEEAKKHYFFHKKVKNGMLIELSSLLYPYLRPIDINH